MHATFLQTERLRYSYRKEDPLWVLSGIDLFVGPDAFLLVCGPSGSGKSTLCRTFNGLIPHFHGGVLRGEVRVAGKSTTGQSVGELFRQVGMVFQDPETQLFNATVEYEIAFGLESLGLPPGEIGRRIHESAAQAGIPDLLQRNPHALSGGEQQLVSIAAVLAHRPGMIVLDEPYANLDPYHVRRVREILRTIRKSGIGVVICEHRLPYTIPDVCRVVVLDQGRIVSDTTPHELVNLDMEQYGLELPLAARVGKRLGLSQVPLDIDDIPSDSRNVSALSDLKPRPPAPLPAGAPSVLTVENLSFSIEERPLLRDVSFVLAKGESLAIVGANGAGKTLLLKHLNGLYRPQKGRVTLMDKDTRKTKVSRLARHIGTAFQNPNNQFFKLTVREEIAVSATALGCYDPDWIEELVALFHLKPLLDRAPFRLSGGEKRRVAFAAALAARPAVLALDEPTAGQGWYFRRALGRLLGRLRDRGQSLILVTHDLAFAEAHAHRWLVLARGQVIAQGRPTDVMADHRILSRAHLEPTDAHRLWGGGVQH